MQPNRSDRPIRRRVSARAGIAVRHATLSQVEVVVLRGFLATTLVVTLTDLCRRLSVVEAVVIADAALHNGLIDLDALRSWVDSNRGRHGIKTLRRVVSFAEPAAESAMETRLRMTLVLGGLPRPRAQVAIYDDQGRFAGRPDLFYEEHRVGIEYDGGIHRDRLVEDNRRQNRLLDAGVRLLRFTAPDVLGNPHLVVAQVASMIGFSGKTLTRRLRRHDFSGKIASRAG